MEVKRSILAAVIVLGQFAGFGSTALARDAEPVNNLLNQSLRDQEIVQQSYAGNSAAVRPEVSERKNSEKFEVVVGEELSASTSRLKGFNRADAHSYRERNIAQRLDREVREVDSSFDSEGHLTETRPAHALHDL